MIVAIEIMTFRLAAAAQEALAASPLGVELVVLIDSDSIAIERFDSVD